MVCPLLVPSKIIMPTIKVRKQANGSTRYTAVVRIRRGTTVLHQESRTFTHRTAALSWAKHREVALEDPAELTRQRLSTPTLAELIRWYIDTFETISRWQRSKQTHLEFLERHALGKTNALTLTSADLIRHVQSRRADGAGPATVINDLIWIGVVLRAAKSVRELPVSPEIVQQARSACGELRPIGKPRKRTRRPTADELVRLREHFKGRDRRVGSRKSADSNGATTMRPHAPAWSGTPSTRLARTGIIGDSNIRPRPGRLSPLNSRRASGFFLMTPRASAPHSREPVTCWEFRICVSMICGMRPPVACSNAATKSMKSHSSRCMSHGTSSSATQT
jgi:hypothetical protein